MPHDDYFLSGFSSIYPYSTVRACDDYRADRNCVGVGVFGRLLAALHAILLSHGADLAVLAAPFAFSRDAMKNNCSPHVLTGQYRMGIFLRN